MGAETLLSCQGGNDGFNFLCNYAGHGAWTGNAPQGDFKSGAPCWAVGEADGKINQLYPSCGAGCTHYSYVECEKINCAEDVSQNGKMVFGHHGACSGWNDCGTGVFSLEHTSITASVTLVTATPLLLAIWSLLTGKDRPEVRHWLAIGLAFIGVSIITQHDAAQGDSSLMGDAMALLGAAGMAGYFLTARRLGDSLDIWVFSGIATGFGAMALWLTALTQGIPFEAASTDALIYLALAALIPQLIGHTSLTWVLRFKRPTIVGIATVGEPIGATLIGWLWLDLGVDSTTAIGCLVTMTAVGVALYEPSR